MKRKIFGLFLAVATLVFMGCPNPVTDPPASDKAVTLLAIPGVICPVIDEIPVTAVDTSQFTGTVNWSPTVSGTFVTNTVYTATILLTPKSGYILAGVAANSFTIDGASSVNHNANSGEVTAMFPSTSATSVTLAAIPGVIAPVTGAIPVTSVDSEQYTGTVSWSPTVSGTFAADIMYTATIMLTPKSGNTLMGVAANSYTVDGASSVTHNANSGVVSAIFPSTLPIIPGTLFTSDYIDSTPGKSIRYKITYPTNYSATKVDNLSLTFQSVNSTTTIKRFFCTSVSGRDSSASMTVDVNGIRSNGGSTNTPGSILMQKLNLPASISNIGTTEWNVTSTWHGIGTYLITPISSFSIDTSTYQDCLKIEFPTSKLSFNDQKGHGFYILAREIGIIYYEATLDENGSIGNIGQKVIYEGISDTYVSSRQLQFRIIDSGGVPQAGAFLDFNSGYGPQVVANTSGIFQIPVYLSNGDSLGSLFLYLSTNLGRGEFMMEAATSASPVGDISLGDVTYTLPEFSDATVTLSPANGAVNVSSTITELVVTFSKSMSTGYSWVNFNSADYPTATGTPIWTGDTVIKLPVSLVQGKTYTVGLNSSVYLSFRDTSGKPIVPIIWTFTTVP